MSPRVFRWSLRVWAWLLGVRVSHGPSSRPMAWTDDGGYDDEGRFV
jgi:hypothetical protein